MRKQREFFKPKNKGVYLHVYNRTVTLGESGYPFAENEKVMLKFIAEKFLIKYNIELISFVIMSNHFHMLVYCPTEKLSIDEAHIAYNSLHSKKFIKPVPIEDSRVKTVIENSNNISEYMREVQCEFSKWFNKSRPYKRKGSLWEDRFKSQLIESDAYLWGCIKYLEMNPVRAGISQTPEAYKFSSYGRWHSDKKHPYESHFLKHILKLANSESSITELKALMSIEMQKMKIFDYIKIIEDPKEYQAALKLKEKLDIEHNKITTKIDAQILVFAKKDLLSGNVIGSKDFIKEKYRQWALHKNSA